MSKQDYALVSGGAILSICRAEVPPRDGEFSDEFPEDAKWLPIIEIDSRPFDATKHVRLAPREEIIGDVVRRVFPVIDRACVKSQKS